ncbi:MAG: hypothetical protein HY812_17005 [Planctomycetes bacterium]|nr:hypothetical protein [Planctomycetota bacterium]
MGQTRFHAEVLVELLRRQTVATTADLKAALGTTVDMTVFRKLREIPYVSSYSHSGRFYTLRDVAEFDARGLWSHQGIRFSQHGSLVDTAERFVVTSERGYSATELRGELGVEVKEALLTLVRTGRLVREEVSGQYVYCAPQAARGRQQLVARRLPIPEEPFEPARARGMVPSDEVRAAIVLFLSTLNEKQRRLYAGLESLRVGHGGDRRLAELTGMDVHTIAKGRRELLLRDSRLDRIRREGGGRKAVEKKCPR